MHKMNKPKTAMDKFIVAAGTLTFIGIILLVYVLWHFISKVW